MPTEPSEVREPNDAWIRALRRALLAFYDERRRDLPWRREPDPYRVWVSEVMLQQTRVETVIPYYERWLRRFPTIEALAAADADDVLRAWEGLGYYSRARNLHHAARIVRERHAGDVPAEAAALRALPGVGDYTAGAIASIAYARREPAVDGNVRRVLARLLDVATPSPIRLREVATALVPADRPGDFNQALMELGATICVPRSPRCAECPATDLCRARRKGTQHLRPRTPRRAPVATHALVVAVLVASDGAVLLVRRPERGLLAGLWSLPATELGPSDEPAAVATALAARYTVDVAPGTPVPLRAIRHTFTHRRELYLSFRFDVLGLTVRGTSPGIAWVAPAGLGDYPMPVAQRRILRLLVSG